MARRELLADPELSAAIDRELASAALQRVEAPDGAVVQ
jgi:hypothetical protein